MALTIREALKLAELAQVQVEAGAAGLDNIVQMVSVMEVPDISSFVEAGELLLTTTYPIRNNPSALHKLIPTLAKRGLAGLAIKPERYIDSIPAAMVEQANALNFPLLRLPKEPSFTKILNAIMGEILHEQAKLLRYQEVIHRRLTEIILKGQGNDALVQTLAELVNLPAAFINCDLEIIATADVSGTVDISFFDSLSYIKAKDFYTAKKVSSRYRVQINDGISTILIHPVKAGTDIFGYLCILEHAEPLLQVGIAAVDQVSVALALNVEKQRAVKEMERRFLNEFVQDILEGRIKSLGELRLRGKVYGWGGQFPQILLVIKVTSTREQDAVPESIHDKMQIQQKIERIIGLDQATSAHSKLVSHMGNTTILLFKPRDQAMEAAKREACHLAQRLLDKIQADTGAEQYAASIGISALCQDVFQMPGAFRQAQQALQVSTLANTANSVAHYDDLGVYRLLTCIDDVEELERFCIEKIGRLLAYDASHGTSLTDTLDTLIKADGNLQRASELLFVHYNTLRYRVQRIEQIADIKIDSWEAMIDMALAIKCRYILEDRKKDL